MLILAVEDEQALLQAISGVLTDEGYQVDTADRGDDGLLLAQRGIYDLLVLDIMMPGMDGLTLSSGAAKATVECTGSSRLCCIFGQQKSARCNGAGCCY